MTNGFPDGNWELRAPVLLPPALSRYLGQHLYAHKAALELLTGLSSDRLSRLAAAKTATAEARSVLESVEALLRHVPRRSVRPYQERTGELRGTLAWSQTITRRLATGDPTVVGGRTWQRVDDDRILGSAVRILDLLQALLSRAGSDTQHLDDQRHRASTLRRHGALRRTRSLWSERHVAALPNADLLISFVARAEAALAGNRNTLVEAAQDHLLGPAALDRCFELLVGQRIVEYLEARGWTEQTVDLHQGGSIRRQLRRADGELATLSFQTPVRTLDGATRSVYRDTLVRSGLSPSDLVPDWILDVTTLTRRHTVVVECKHTEQDRAAADRAGLSETIAYLADSDLTAQGLVVAWNSMARPSSGPIVMASLATLEECLEIIID